MKKWMIGGLIGAGITSIISLFGLLHAWMWDNQHFEPIIASIGLIVNYHLLYPLFKLQSFIYGHAIPSPNLIFGHQFPTLLGYIILLAFYFSIGALFFLVLDKINSMLPKATDSNKTSTN